MGKPLTWIKNYFGNKLYPYTHMDAVYTDDEEKKTLATTISELKDSIDNTSKVQSDWNEDDTGHDSYIKNKPLSLPANGGNSDTLEGKHASDFTEKNIFDAHLTDSDAHQDLFDSKLNIESANKLIKNISFDTSTGIIMVTRQDNTTFTINIPRSLIFQSAVFNEQSNEIIITWSDHSESRIPVEGLVDIYTGSEGNIIQIEVDDNNIISAVVKEGSIDKSFLSQSAGYVLKETALKVFIRADLSARVQRKLALGIDIPEDKMPQHIQAIDKKRSQYYQHYTDQIWGDVQNYNLCIDTTEIGTDCGSELIMCYLKQLGEIS